MCKSTSDIQTNYCDIFRMHTAVFDGYCGAEDSTDKCGQGSTRDEAVRDLIEQTETCELDCANCCTHCDRYFHDIKVDEGLSHLEELPESYRTVDGRYGCHIDCGA
jgi:hypothetical protein